MFLYHYMAVVTAWILYGSYCYAQYSDKIKASPWFLVIALVYSLTANLLWVYLSKNMDQKNTLNYALLWDGGVHIVAFSIPILVFGDKIKTHTAIGMSLIFSGLMVILFYDKVIGLIK